MEGLASQSGHGAVHLSQDRGGNVGRKQAVGGVQATGGIQPREDRAS